MTTHIYSLEGNTYRAKDMLRGRGWKWSAQSKMWTIEGDESGPWESGRKLSTERGRYKGCRLWRGVVGQPGSAVVVYTSGTYTAPTPVANVWDGGDPDDLCLG